MRMARYVFLGPRNVCFNLMHLYWKLSSALIEYYSRFSWLGFPRFGERSCSCIYIQTLSRLIPSSRQICCNFAPVVVLDKYTSSRVVWLRWQILCAVHSSLQSSPPARRCTFPTSTHGYDMYKGSGWCSMVWDRERQAKPLSNPRIPTQCNAHIHTHIYTHT